MLAKFLIFCLIWIVSTAFLTFMGYGLFPGTSIFTIGVIACLISWVIAIIFTVLKSVTKGEIDTQKLVSGDPDYTAYPGDIANYSMGPEDVGGHLYFFPESLVFHPATKDESKLKDRIMPYKNIVDVKQGNAINKIQIESNDGSKDVFAVHNKDKWIAQIRKKAEI